MANKTFTVVDSYHKTEKICDTEARASRLALKLRTEILEMFRWSYPGNKWAWEEIKRSRYWTEFLLVNDGKKEGINISVFTTSRVLSTKG